MNGHTGIRGSGGRVFERMMKPPKTPNKDVPRGAGYASAPTPLRRCHGYPIKPGSSAAHGYLLSPSSTFSVSPVFSMAPTSKPCNPSKRIAPRQQGFTLIEVLIALAVLTICMSALIQAGGTRADHVGYLRDRTLAHWIATDRVTEFRLAEDWPAAGTQEGETEMAGRTWSWQAEISETPEPAVRRVEVAVGIGEDGEPLSRVVGFLGDPGDRVR